MLHRAPARRDVLFAAMWLGWALARVVAATDPWTRLEAAWVCLFAGGLLVALALKPPELGDLIGTGLSAAAGASVAGVLLLTLTGSSWPELRWIAEHHFRDQLRFVTDRLGVVMLGMEVESGAAGRFDTMVASAEATVSVAAALLPALLLLQSLAALALAWVLYRWTAREPVGVRLPRLSEFRFNDHLIWGLILAVLTIVVPGLGRLQALGENLTAFFGGLYVARGLGVVAALAAAGGVGGPVAWLFGILMLVFLLPLVAFSALAVGVLDTWMDWRKRLAALKR